MVGALDDTSTTTTIDDIQGDEIGSNAESGVELASRVATGRRRFSRGITLASIGSLIPYLAVLWNIRVDPLRTAVNGGIFSNFFDMQARALMRGHLNLPHGSLSIEAFISQGREYTYFPPGPALLRIPVFLLTDRLDGKFTAISMLLAWIVTAALLGRLLWRVRTIIRGTALVTQAEIVAASLVQASVLCGSVLLFLGSMPWVYHEVYAWSIPMALGAVHALIGVLERPSWGRIAATGGFTLGAILCRTTSGFACAFALLGTAVWFRTSRRSIQGRKWGWRLGVAGAVPLAIGVAINWAKFQHPFMFPLQNQIWTTVNPHRRAALAANGGDLVSPNLFWSTSVNYLRPNGVRFISTFPFITPPANVAQSYGGGFLDQTYRTGSITACMPLLVGLSVIGVVATFRRGASAAMCLFRIPLLGAAAITGGIMFYGYIAYRYTSEFMPFLIVGSAIGVTIASSRWASTNRRARRTLITVLAIGMVYGLAANAAFAVQQMYLSNPGVMLRDYTNLVDKISNVTGHPLGGFTRQSRTLPRNGPADRLQIVGDCDALFIGTGEPLAPWVPVEIRNVAFALRHIDQQSDGQRATTEIPLATFTSFATRTLFLQPVGGLRYRLGLRDSTSATLTDTMIAPGSDPIFVNILAVTDVGKYVIEVNGQPSFEVRMLERDADWATFPNVVRRITANVGTDIRGSWSIEPVPTAPALSCTRLL